MSKIHIFTIAIVFIASSVLAAEVKDVVSKQIGNRAEFTYNLIGDEVEAEVSFSVTVGSKIYKASDLHLEGDFGTVRIGKGKKIYWNVLQDFPKGIRRDITWEIGARKKGFMSDVPYTNEKYNMLNNGKLRVGDGITDFRLSDANDKEYSLSSPEFAGRVVYIVYASSSSADDNNHVSDAMRASWDLKRLRSENKYVGLGIGNMKDSPVPNFMIKQIARRKQRITGAIILLDPDFTFGNLVGAPHKIATSIIVDKDRIVRYIYSGITPRENIPQIIELIKKYAEKNN